MTAQYTVRVSPEAHADIDRYANHIYDATGFLQRAIDTAEAIENAIYKLDIMPQRGAPAPHFGATTRTLNYRGFATILYEIDETAQTVTVLRVFVRGQFWSRA